MGFLPPRPFLHTLLLRVAVVWAFLHGVLLAGSRVTGVPFPRSVTGSASAAVWVTVATVLVVCLEMRRNGELIFLANLGYSSRRIAAVAAAQCLLFDFGLRLTLA